MEYLAFVYIWHLCMLTRKTTTTTQKFHSYDIFWCEPKNANKRLKNEKKNCVIFCVNHHMYISHLHNDFVDHYIDGSGGGTVQNQIKFVQIVSPSRFLFLAL